jgi:hypothetical protein
MKKLDVINAELTRLHATYSMIVEKSTTLDSGILTDVQEKISFLHDVLDQYSEGDGYPIADLMYDDSEDDAN